MDIERLKELREAVFEDYREYEVKNLKDEDGKVYPSTVPLDECYPIGKELLVLVDEAIANQSATSEEVQKAIKRFEKRNNKLKEVQDNGDAGCVDIETWEKYQGFIEDNNLAITALQAYQPWVSVEDEKPESGKHVLLCCEVRPSGKRYVCDGYYANSKSITSGCSDEWDYEYDEETDEYYLVEGYYEVIKNWGDYSSIAIDDFVVAWKPLPEPPKGE